MSVRRLAEDSVQPADFAFEGENAAWAEHTIGKYPAGRQQSAVIPLLMRAQEQDGWVTKAAIEHVADLLTMPLIRVLEVATFYTQFQLKPVGSRAHIQVCGTTPCMLRGSDDLKRVCQAKIHEEQFHLNASGTLSWEEVECLGACVNAPMVMVFKDTYEDLTAERLEEIIAAFDRGDGANIPVGPQNGRHLSAPIGGLTSLTVAGEPAAAAQDGPANGSPEQGAGAGAAGDGPSAAARPTTNVAETDPTIAAPGKAENRNVDPGVEAAKSIGSFDGADAAEGNSAELASTPAGEKPAGLLDTAPSKTDDLQRIRGVGPFIEAELNRLGVFTFSQIAGWTTAELVWIDDNLNFRGRALRDRWIDQARVLADGGTPE